MYKYSYTIYSYTLKYKTENSHPQTFLGRLAVCECIYDGICGNNGKTIVPIPMYISSDRNLRLTPPAAAVPAARAPQRTCTTTIVLRTPT